jgi:hypothetical protein
MHAGSRESREVCNSEVMMGYEPNLLRRRFGSYHKTTYAVQIHVLSIVGSYLTCAFYSRFISDCEGDRRGDIELLMTKGSKKKKGI